MQRATGARRTDGNRIRLQFEGPLTFDTWIEAIASAERFVHFENYVFRDDPVGRRFRDALAEKARSGVPVRVLYDWMGCWATPRRYWKPLRQAGAEVRAFKPPQRHGSVRRAAARPPQAGVRGRACGLPGRVLHRPGVGGHGRRSSLAGHRSGGHRPRGRRGPPEHSNTSGHPWARPVPESIRADPEQAPRAGNATAWMIEGVPWRSRVYRALQLVAANARHRLWMTDPYFLTPRPMMEALVAAARDGVDVRVLVPSNNNWPWVGSLSRGGYRGLLENGVRIFEFQGPMIHAKTSVSDGQWCRIGSSNLNAASLLGNWEIDIGILDREFAAALEALFLGDLASSVEIVLPERALSRALTEPGTDPEHRRSSLEPSEALHRRLRNVLTDGSARQVRVRVADLLRAGSTFGQALAGRRMLGREDRTVLGDRGRSPLPGRAGDRVRAAGGGVCGGRRPGVVRDRDRRARGRTGAPGATPPGGRRPSGRVRGDGRTRRGGALMTRRTRRVCPDSGRAPVWNEDATRRSMGHGGGNLLSSCIHTVQTGY